MKTIAVPRLGGRPGLRLWKRPYMAAILERNPGAVIGLIEYAKAQLLHRHSELIASGIAPCDEPEAIHDAFYLLDAPQSSLPYRDDLLN